MAGALRNAALAAIFLAAVAALSGLGGPVFAQPVPVGEDVYRLLEETSLQGLLPVELPQTLPLDRQDVASLLIALENNRRNGAEFPTVLAEELRRWIAAYKREIIRRAGLSWWDELPAYRSRIYRYTRSFVSCLPPETMFGDDGHALSLDYPGGRWLTLDPSFVFQWDRRPGEDDVFRRRWGFEFAAEPLPSFTIFLHWRDVAEWGRGPYTADDRGAIFDDRVGFVNANAGDVLAYEDLLGGMQLRIENLALFIGRDRVRWGPGRFGNLMLSGEGPSYSQGRMTITLGGVARFTALAGFLAPWPEMRDSLYISPSGKVRAIRDSKYLAAHRIEISPSSKISFALQEAVVYGERNPDLSYLNPVTVYFSEEHDNGDQDNALMGADFRFGPFYRLTGWGEVLLDDFRFGRLGTDYYGNKLALLGGMAFAGPGGAWPIEGGAEYALLRPFVYTHFYPINTFKHWNTPLGLQLQPNSDRFSAWLTWQPRAFLRLGMEGHLLRHGANDLAHGNVGGDIDSPHVDGESENAPFLAGTRRDRYRLIVWAEWEAFEGLILDLALGRDEEIQANTGGLIISAGLTLNMPDDRRWSLRKR